MIKRLPEILAVILICFAVILIIRQQVISSDRLFNIRQMWHHETLIVSFAFGAICLVVGKYLGKFRE